MKKVTLAFQLILGAALVGPSAAHAIQTVALTARARPVLAAPVASSALAARPAFAAARPAASAPLAAGFRLRNLIPWLQKTGEKLEAAKSEQSAADAMAQWDGSPERKAAMARLLPTFTREQTQVTLSERDFHNAADPAFEADVKAAHEDLARVDTEIHKVIVGQNKAVQSVIMAKVAGKHVLYEGNPGTGKTLLAKTANDAMGGTFSRIQGTSDLQPSDIRGMSLLQEDLSTGKRYMEDQPGPVRANTVLVDEINRMQPKTQSALLDVMEEEKFVVGKTVYSVDQPSSKIATMNPIESEGVFPLPEAQVNRFFLKDIIVRLSLEEKALVRKRMEKKEGLPKAEKVIEPARLIEIRRLAERVYVHPAIDGYIGHIIEATSDPMRYGINVTVQQPGVSGSRGDIKLGAAEGERPSNDLLLAARIHAVMNGRTYVAQEDVLAVVHRVVGHRILLTSRGKRRMTVDQFIDAVLLSVGPKEIGTVEGAPQATKPS